ncbi:MAG: ABC transporter substrate-binding protein, partial [Pseudomonadota bacterium]
MKRIMVFVFILVLTPLLFGGTRLGNAKETRGVTNDTIKVGVIEDLTGPVSDSCKPIADGIKNYFLYTNDQGGINGRNVRVIIEDNRYSIPLTLASFKKLLHRDEVFAMDSAPTGGVTALFSLIEKHKVPFMTANMAYTM